MRARALDRANQGGAKVELPRRRDPRRRGTRADPRHSAPTMRCLVYALVVHGARSLVPVRAPAARCVAVASSKAELESFMDSTLGGDENTDTKAAEALTDYTSDPSGLKYKDTVVGSGASPRDGDEIEVHYAGWSFRRRGSRRNLERERGTERCLESGRSVLRRPERVAGPDAGAEKNNSGAGTTRPARPRASSSTTRASGTRTRASSSSGASRRSSRAGRSGWRT